MASCTYVSQSCYNVSAWQTDNPYCHVGTQGSSNYCTAMIKFTTPSFTGNSTNIKFKFYVGATSKTTVSLRYAIATSDKNKNSYTKTYSTVSDSYQVASGTTSLDATNTLGTDTISINTTALQGGNTYYLFLWSSKSGDSNSYVTIQPQGVGEVNHTITITYEDGGHVYIYDGTNFVAYDVYVYNGSDWDRYTPYIYNGSDWDKYG